MQSVDFLYRAFFEVQLCYIGMFLRPSNSRFMEINQLVCPSSVDGCLFFSTFALMWYHCHTRSYWMSMGPGFNFFGCTLEVKSLFFLCVSLTDVSA